jgi:hypothetical protein
MHALRHAWLFHTKWSVCSPSTLYLRGLSPIILPEGQVVHVVEALAEVTQDGLWVAALGQDVQQVGWGHKVEAREGNALGLQVVLWAKVPT